MFDTGFIYRSMIIDLTQIEGASRRFEFSIPPEELGVDEASVRFMTDVVASGEVKKQTAQVDVNGQIRADVEIDCTRCLKPVPHNLAIEFVASYVTREHFAADKEREVAADDLDTDVLDDDHLDVKDVVREQILLNLPTQLFCKPDCKGLCPECGADRNLIDCDCELDRTDPRWAALKDFRS